MWIKKIFAWIFFAGLVSGCDQRWVEWDKPIPGLHGEVIQFIEPVIYLSETEEFFYDFDPEQLGINREIYVEADKRRAISSPDRYTYESIAEGQEFAIVGSYWTRLGMIYKAFSDEAHVVVLENAEKERSTMSFYFFKYSNKPNLVKYKNYGKRY